MPVTKGCKPPRFSLGREPTVTGKGRLVYQEATMKAEDVRGGVADAVDFWLSQHDVSTPECIIEGVQKAAAAWMSEHADEIIESVAAKVAAEVLQKLKE